MMNIDPVHDSLSYWHATHEPMLPQDTLPSSAEVVVIGAGMLGVWTAYWLAKAGVPTVVVEKDAIGWGATGRNGGFLVGGAAVGYQRLIELLGRKNAKLIYALTIAGQELPYKVLAEEGIDCDLRRSGTAFLARSPEMLVGLQQQHDLLVEDGFESEILDRRNLEELISTPLSDEIVGGSFSRSGGLLHSSHYLAGLAQAAARQGARFVQAQAISLKPNGDGATIHTTAGIIDAGRVVVALNAWTDELIHDARGVIVPMRGQILAYKPIAPVFTAALGTDITPTGEYWQQTPDGSIIIGGCRADADGWEMNIRDSIATPSIINHISQVIPRLFPELNNLQIDRSWAGLMAYTADGLPVVDHIEGSRAVWYAGGFNGHGMPFGPILGKMLAGVAQGHNPTPELNLLGRSRTSL